MTSCRSRKRLKIRSCRGGCSTRPGFCCKPKRFKKRRVKFRCPSGRRYERWIRLIRKCGCKPCWEEKALFSRSIPHHNTTRIRLYKCTKRSIRGIGSYYLALTTPTRQSSARYRNSLSSNLSHNLAAVIYFPSTILILCLSLCLSLCGYFGIWL